jgi:hypothetical protein
VAGSCPVPLAIQRRRRPPSGERVHARANGSRLPHARTRCRVAFARTLSRVLRRTTSIYNGRTAVSARLTITAVRHRTGDYCECRATSMVLCGLSFRRGYRTEN